MKKILLIVVMLITCFAFVGCMETDNIVSQETDYTDDIMSNAFDTVGFPDVTNYFERAQLKEIYELRDDPNLICYWYIKNEMTGKWIYQGTCIGYGIPYTTSMTAPESLQNKNSSYGYLVLPLAEPNGLYSSSTTSATWILTSVDGEIKPVYVESEITVSQEKIDARLCEEWSLTSDY